MVDLAYTAEEVNDETKCAPCVEEGKGPKYPWGLSFSLEEGSLKKLGMDASSFSGGQTVTFTAGAIVTGINSSERQDGSRSECVTFTMTDIEMPKSKSDRERAAKMYNKEE